MSRVGKYPVIVPDGVNVTIEPGNVLVKGKNGELSCHYDADHISVELDGNKVVVATKGESKHARALWGTTRANINTLVKGVQKNWSWLVLVTKLVLKAISSLCLWDFLMMLLLRLRKA